MRIAGNRYGMTLVEILVATAILSMVGVTLMSILTHSLTGWSSTASRDTATSQATVALQRLSNDVRDGRSASVTSGVLTVVFPMALHDSTTGETVYDSSSEDPTPRRYYISGGDLVRAAGSAISVIGRGIGEATFAAYGETVAVTLTSSEQIGKSTATQEVTGRVTLRNYQD